MLVHNAGGGVGIAATQLARMRRATVIGTASAMKHDALRSFGVDHAIDYRHANVADGSQEDHPRPRRRRHSRSDRRPQLHRQLPDARAARAAGDVRPVSGRARRAPQLVARLQAWAATPRFNPLSMINRNRGVFGLNVGHLWDERPHWRRSWNCCSTSCRAGRLHPVVAKTFPLDRVADAHRFIQSRCEHRQGRLTT